MFKASLSLFPMITITVSLMLSCSSSDGGNQNTDGPFEDRCQVHCDSGDDLECSEQDRTECLTECRTFTGGLEFMCGVCLIGEGTPLYGETVNDQQFCLAGSVRSINNTNCANFCVGATHSGNSTDIEDRCEVHCDSGDDLECSEQDRAECLTECGTSTNGLEFMCGACLIGEGTPLYGETVNDEQFCLGGSVRSINNTNCSDFCQ